MVNILSMPDTKARILRLILRIVKRGIGWMMIVIRKSIGKPFGTVTIRLLLNTKGPGRWKAKRKCYKKQ